MSVKLSAQYLDQLKALHRKSFGRGSRIPEQVKKIINEDNIKTFLDFGCGKGLTSNTIRETYPNLNLYSYDPVTSPIDLPKKVNMIYSSDVLEHVEPEHLDDTLNILFKTATQYQYHLIACHRAKKKLPDGRNAHLIIEKPDWWKKKLEEKMNKFGWKFIHESVTEHYYEKYDINAVKYISVIKKVNPKQEEPMEVAGL